MPGCENELHQRDDGLIETKVDRLLKSLRSDPRFAAFLKKLNLPIRSKFAPVESNFWEAGALKLPGRA
jgi:hypothetical protein